MHPKQFGFQLPLYYFVPVHFHLSFVYYRLLPADAIFHINQQAGYIPIVKQSTHLLSGCRVVCAQLTDPFDLRCHLVTNTRCQ